MATKTTKTTVTKPVEKTTQPEVTHVYKSQRGVVVGRYHGQKAAAATRDFTAESLEALIKKIQKAFDNNTLDTDLVFKEVICAGVQIVDISSVEIEGKIYTNTSIHNEVFGDKEFFQDMVDSGEIVDDLPIECC